MDSRIILTDKAKLQLRDMEISTENFLRIRIADGGCSGLTYHASIDDRMDPLDTVVYQDADVRIISDEQSAIYLEGITLDYSDDLIQSGFKFTNPNAVKSCGCGSSFAV